MVCSPHTDTLRHRSGAGKLLCILSMTASLTSLGTQLHALHTFGFFTFSLSTDAATLLPVVHLLASFSQPLLDTPLFSGPHTQLFGLLPMAPAVSALMPKLLPMVFSMFLPRVSLVLGCCSLTPSSQSHMPMLVDFGLTVSVPRVASASVMMMRMEHESMLLAHDRTSR